MGLRLGPLCATSENTGPTVNRKIIGSSPTMQLGVYLALGPVFSEVAHRGPSLNPIRELLTLFYTHFVCVCLCVCVCVYLCVSVLPLMNTTHFTPHPPSSPPPPPNPLRSSDKGQKLQEAWEQQQFLRAVEDIEDWIGDMESQMASEDLGRDLISVNNLIKKHAVRQSICCLSLSFVCLFVYLSLGLSLFSVCLVCLPVGPYPSIP